jgi:hypothetical protein
MILFRRSCDNGAEEPWNHEACWVFEITFSWKTFLLGGSFGDGVYALNVGPFTFIFFYNWSLR